VAGLTLVLMEVLNEYGAVKYFGVSTFTTGIFRAWFSLGDGPAAIRLSAALLVLVFALILVERPAAGAGPLRPRVEPLPPGGPRFRLDGMAALGGGPICALPVLLGFLVPVGQLVVWAVQVAPEALDRRFLTLALNSFGLATAAALLAVAAALLIVYAVRLSPTPFLRLGARASSLGYSIPGAVIAVGILVPFLWVDRNLAAAFAPSWDRERGAPPHGDGGGARLRLRGPLPGRGAEPGGFGLRADLREPGRDVAVARASPRCGRSGRWISPSSGGRFSRPGSWSSSTS
jgi:ABC-type Fe3+ transport system permease subunit